MAEALALAPAPAGHNNPPAPTPFEAVKIHMDDLLVEARNWADGQAVESDAQAAEVDRLIDDLRKAEKAADEARKEEVAPLDLQRDAIQDRYNEYIAPLKNRKPGKLSVALAALKATVEPWRKKKADEAAAAALAKRLEAEKKAAEAAAAMRARDTSNIADVEAAEALVSAAETAEREANRAAKAATTGTGLSTYFEAVMTVQRDAIIHYMHDQPAAFVTLCQQLADQDVRSGKRVIPGFTVEERKRVR